MRVTFITPNLPPIACGLADHCLNLGRALSDQGVDVSMIGLAGDPDEANRVGWPGPAALWNQGVVDLRSLLEVQHPDWIWVQLSAYGYSRFGAPYVFGYALRRAIGELPQTRVAVCVHELHCGIQELGPKGLLLSPWQRWTVGRIIRMGQLIITTNDCYLLRCRTSYGVSAERLRLIPLGSSLPEAGRDQNQLEERRDEWGLNGAEKVAVTFGRWASQVRALEIFRAKLQQAMEDGSIGRVIAVGGETAEIPPQLTKLKLQSPWEDKLHILGPQPAHRISEILSIADVGLVPTPLALWEKSTAARAFQQAGLTLWIENVDGPFVLTDYDPPLAWPVLAHQVHQLLSI